MVMSMVVVDRCIYRCVPTGRPTATKIGRGGRRRHGGVPAAGPGRRIQFAWRWYKILVAVMLYRIGMFSQAEEEENGRARWR